MKGNGRNLVKVLSQNFIEGTGKNDGRIQVGHSVSQRSWNPELMNMKQGCLKPDRNVWFQRRKAPHVLLDGCGCVKGSSSSQASGSIILCVESEWIERT
jgi:hypothetical protein